MILAIDILLGSARLGAAFLYCTLVLAGVVELCLCQKRRANRRGLAR